MPQDKWSVDHFIFAEYETTNSSLGIYRILFAACILFVYLPEHLWISGFPNSFFTPPPGPTAIFFTGFPGLWFFRLLNGLEVVAATLLIFGCRTRLASLSLGIMLFVGNCWAFSFGKINHDILMILVPLVMAFSTWRDAYSVDAKQRGPSEAQGSAWPVALIALLTAFGMMSAAVPKVASGWLNPHSHAVLGRMLLNIFVIGRSNWIATILLRIHSGLFWEFLDYATVAVEASFLFLVVRRKWFRIVCAAACFFHLGIALSMNIAYWPNLLAYGAFVDWSILERHNGIGRQLLERWKDFLAVISPIHAFAVGAFVTLLYLTYGNPLHRVAALFPAESDPLGLLVCIFAGIVATIYLLDWFETPGPGVVLFDGYCGLCNGWVDFVLRHDHRGAYKFGAIQSPVGEQMIAQAGMPPGFVGSVILFEDGRPFFRSTAIIRILRGMGFPYSLAGIYTVVPRGLRDAVYDVIASHRYGWFGRREACRIPTAVEKERFV